MTKKPPPRAPLEPGDLVFGYGRDSGGAEQEASVPQQRAQVEVYITAHGYQLAGWYADERRPGSDTENREAFLALIDACCAPPPPVKAVIVWDFARFSRNEADRAYFPALLARHGVQMISITQQLPDGPTAGIMREVLTFTDSEYLRTLSRNVKRGLAAAAAQGRHHGRQVPAGYTRVVVTIGQHRDGTPRTIQQWQVDPEAAGAVRLAFQLYAIGTSIKEIHAQTHLVQSRTGYNSLLANPIYIGQLRTQDGLVPAPELRIVDDATWSAVQARKSQRIAPRRVNSTYLLSGLLYCATCDRRMVGSWSRVAYGLRDYRYYRCAWRIESACSQMVMCDKVDAPVLATVIARLTEPAHVDAIVAALQAQAAQDPGPAQARALDADIAQAARAITTLLDLAETGTLALGEIRKRLAERESALAALRRQRAGLPIAQVAPFDASKFKTWLADLVMQLQEDDVLVVRRALAQVVARVVYDPATGIEIVYAEAIRF